MDLYHLLDKLGYSRDNSEKLIKVYDNASIIGTLVANRNLSEDLEITVCGSRGEGQAGGLDRDVDVLFIQRAVKCFEYFTPEEDKKYPATFVMDFENVPDGYTKLRLHSMISASSKNRQLFSQIRSALEKQNGHYYLGNNVVFSSAIEYNRPAPKGGWFRKNVEFDDVAGPSRPFIFKVPAINRHIQADYVQAFPCSYPSSIEKWISRERKYDWPSRDLIEAIKQLDVFVVPVGNKGSEEKDLQWRVSMTLSERALVRSFNDTQIKLYAGLKMIVKQEIKPICKDISSYLVKNILFWVFEDTAMCDMDRNNFNCLFLKILTYLKNGISRNNLPCYTFPSRNLLENRLMPVQRTEVLQHLDMIIDEGNYALLRCPSVIEYAAVPEKSKAYQVWERLKEQLLLSFFAIDVDVAERLQLRFTEARSELDCFDVFLTQVAPIIRDTNPFGYFDLMKAMSVRDIAYLILGKTTFHRQYIRNKL